jgi:RNA polymerase sigma-70 factor (ECF subfamily)
MPLSCKDCREALSPNHLRSFATPAEVFAMPEGVLDTLYLHQCVQRWQAGDAKGAEVLLRAASQRLEQITRRMLRGYPTVHAWTETADVLQGSLLRLLNTLRQVEPESTRHFFNLAAVNIRRELLDLARRFRRIECVRFASTDATSDSAGEGLLQAAEAATEDHDLDLWCQFHEAVEQLPAAEREVMGLVFYHGWTQAQIAELVGVDERTIRRRWQSACLRLNQLVGDVLPRP